MAVRDRKSALRREYTARINRVLDYIDAHLGEELALETLARVASFSPFHFHRVFGAIVGEPLGCYIQRIRIEKAAGQLLADPERPITAIAYDCGFSGSAAFARAFREYFGMTASEWRLKGEPAACPESAPAGRERKERKTESKAGKTQGKKRKEREAAAGYTGSITTGQWRNSMTPTKLNVEVKRLDPVTVAYVRNIGPYMGDAELFGRLFTRLFQWAGPRNLCGSDTLVMALYHDNPDITDHAKLRLSVCISVPENTRVEGDIGRMVVPGGLYAMARFELKTDGYAAAWDALCGDWLPESGYQPDDRPAFEIYRNSPDEHPEGLCIVDICMPVKPL